MIVTKLYIKSRLNRGIYTYQGISRGPRNTFMVYGDFFSDHEHFCFKCVSKLTFLGYTRIYRTDWKLPNIEHEVWACSTRHIKIFTAGQRDGDQHICNDKICSCGSGIHIIKNDVTHDITFGRYNGAHLNGQLFGCNNGHKIIQRSRHSSNDRLYREFPDFRLSLNRV